MQIIVKLREKIIIKRYENLHRAQKDDISNYETKLIFKNNNVIYEKVCMASPNAYDYVIYF